MTLTIAVLKETAAHERRVAAIPETVKKYIALGCAVHVQQGAGVEASYLDDMYKAAGASIMTSAAECVRDADIILSVQAPDAATIAHMKKGAILAGILSPYKNDALLKDLAAHGVNGFAMELVPRITRAQAMDVLSSQSNLSGYKAVLDACAYFTRGFPM
ncbi:MAG TPA: NAD(P)(+) transhydrogenase (Re/Si-specific) subunit alpha, partial [Micavibrio sp.]